ncbi:extracellular solute-binding protein [Micromonospora sp. KC213]|uniref:extracellular solute-binding protein n=1 Tax=Micromonospora sp. KC213 TaxID=2530378 RepID=UPI00104FD09E|nr:extracellular solute-binding protein [Micromonospora sp. KC213]TDC42576.1 extracellular solute-binding protein [Micromonospora sp. KC213]
MAVHYPRRSLLKLAGAGALAGVAGPLLAGCGDGAKRDVGNAGKDLVPWPTYVPFSGPPPDAPGDANGVQPLYLTYPQQVVRSVHDTVGDGSEVTAMVITYGAPPRPVEANRFWQAINKALNVNLRIVVVPDAEYSQKMTTLMASGDDLPDIIMFSQLALPRAAEFVQAQCADISDLVGGDAVRQYPNLANIPTRAWQAMGRISGRIYGVPLERPAPGNSLFVNRTALNQAGVPVDWDTEGYLAAMRKVTGGRRWGIGGSKSLFGGSGAIAYHAGSLGAPNQWRVDGGKFVSTLTTGQYEEALGVMRRLAEAGAYHPDSLTLSATDLQTFWHSGTVVSISDGFGSVAPNTLAKINGRFQLDLGRPYGPAPTPWRGTGFFGHVAFRKASPERIQMLLRICNYLSAPFGTAEYELATFGVEGVHYTKNANGIAPSALAGVENNTNLPVKYIGVAPAVLYLPGHPEAARAVHEWEKAVLPSSVADPAVGLRSATQSSKGAELNRIVGDAVSAIVFGRKPLSAWQDAVIQWRQAGGDKLAEELAAEYAAAR